VLAAIEELLGAVFSVESTQKLYQREPAGGQTSPEDFRSRQSVKYGHKFCGTQNQESFCWQEPAEI
jgi:hypothetical protein